MSSNFSFDGGGFDRYAKQLMQEEAGKLKRMLEQLGRQYKGRPVAVIKPALKRAFQREGYNLTDPELTEYATNISEGARFTFKVDVR
jgi:predicted nucleic acid-binding Zn ribbon protein